MDDFDAVLNRAFAFWCDTEQLSFERLIGRMAWELKHLMTQDALAVAFVGQTRERRFFVSEPFEGHPLSPDTLIGLLAQVGGEPVRVWDHALDTVRFLDGRVRASIVVRISVPATVSECNELVVWCGSRTSVSQDVLQRITAAAEAVGEWLAAFGPSVSGMIRSGRACAEMRIMVSNLRGILHDVRAPLGILKYTFGQGVGGDEWSGVVKDELRYLERLLGQGAPEESQQSACPTADVGQILNRVRQRFLGVDAERRQISVRLEYEAVFARISEVDLERVITNLVGNACRYAPHGKIDLESSRSGAQVILRVRDSGKGMSPAVRHEILQGRRVSGDGAGWGVGLIHSKSIIEAAGGRLELRAPASGGTEVVVSLPCECPPARGDESLHISEGLLRSFEVHEREVVSIIDDDVAHGESLKRILMARGVTAQSFSSLAEARAAAALEPSSIILCDAHMPDGGAERLLSMFMGQRECPAIGVMSGDVSESLVYKLAASGARGFFAKPVALEEILDWIDLARGQAERRALI